MYIYIYVCVCLSVIYLAMHLIEDDIESFIDSYLKTHLYRFQPYPMTINYI